MSTYEPPPSSKVRVPRKKACKQCSAAKVRCDLKRPHCSRCHARLVECIYGHAGQEQDFRQSLGPNDSLLPPQSSLSMLDSTLNVSSTKTKPVVDETIFTSSNTISTNESTSFGHMSTPSALQTPIKSAPAHESPDWSALDFTRVELVCTVDGSRVRDRWLADILPYPNQRAKRYSSGTVHFLSHVLKTYSQMLLRPGNLPPIIHPSQLAGKIPTPLANLFTLTRMWEGQVQGGETIVRETVAREMDRLFVERRSYDHMNLLAAFQAYLIYAIMAFFSEDSNSDEPLVARTTMINLQEFAHDITVSGLLCPAELNHARPDWDSWIVAATKRRTLYVMYAFDSVYSSLKALPNYIAEELASLPAPESKILWEASKREVWERRYNLHLGTWEGNGLTMDELWPPLDTGDAAKQRRHGRITRWVGEVDNLGMMMFAVTSATYGS